MSQVGWIWILVALVLGMFLGYMIKDLLTDEYVSNVSINKPRVKKGGDMDLAQEVAVHMKKLTLSERIRMRRDARKAKKENS